MCPGPQLRFRVLQLFTPLLALYLFSIFCLTIFANLLVIYFYTRLAVISKMVIVATILFAGSYWLPANEWHPWVRYLII